MEGARMPVIRKLAAIAAQAGFSIDQAIDLFGGGAYGRGTVASHRLAASSTDDSFPFVALDHMILRDLFAL